MSSSQKVGAGGTAVRDWELPVAGRKRITLPAGTYDVFRIEATGANLTNGATLERTVWIAPEKMRGFLAMESLTRRGGTVVEGERTELIDYSSGGWGSSGDTGFKTSY